MYNILKAALEIAPKSDVKCYLNGIHVFTVGNDGLVVEATDGHCLVRVSTNINDYGVECGTDVILERSSIETALKMFKKNQDVPLTIVDNVPTINGLSIDVVDGRFPDTQRVIDCKSGPPADMIGVGLPVMEKCIKAGKAIQASEKFQCMKMHPGDGISGIRYTVESKDLSVLIIQMPAKV